MATVDNLKIAQQLLTTMQQITAQVDKQTEAYEKQAQFVDALCKAQDCFSKLDANKLKEVATSLGEAQEKSKGFGDSVRQAGEQGGILSEKIKNISEKLKKLAVPAEFLNGFKAGLNFSGNMIQGLMKLGGPVLGLMKDLGTIFLSLPGRIMDFFEGAAGSGVDPYRQALEDLRKEFGNLEIGTSASVINMTESMKDLGDSGLKIGKIFGYGREGLAAILRENMEVAKGMGPVFNRFASSLGDALADFTVLRKSTNLSADALKSMYLSAENAGISSADAVRSMSRDIARAERAFGISAKEYGKDLDFMMKETATFGIKAPQEMLKVSTYAKKLGVSMETLKKIMDKTMNFEDAAQQSAKLSEAFNIQTDAVKMMNEQDPTKKMDMLRQAFFKTGKNIEQMTVLERRHLGELTNMSDEELRLAFAQKNRALSGAQIEAQMKKAQKTPISQAEAMQQLGKSIERLVQAGTAMKGGFFNVFMDGFFGGIKRSKEFRDVVRALQGALRAVFYAGREVGRMFVQLFPGIKEMLGGLRDMFSPSRYRALMSKVVEEFRNFFTLLKTDPKGGFENFMKNMKKIFADFFTKGTPAGSKFLDGVKDFFKTLGVLFVQGIKYSLVAMKDLLKALIDVIKNPSALTSAAGEMGSGISGMLKQALLYAIKELGPVMKDVGALFVELLKTLYEKHIQPHITKIILGALAIAFGPALVAGFVRGAVAALFGQGMPSIFKGISSAMSKFRGSSEATEGGRGAPKKPEDAIKESQEKSTSLRSMAKSVFAFTVAVSIIMAALILLAALYEKANIKPQSLLIMIALFSAVSLLFYAMIKMKFFEAIEALGKNIKSIGNVLRGLAIGLGVIAILMIAIAAMVAAGAKILSLVNKESVDLFLDVMNSMTMLLLKLSVVLGVIAVIGTVIYATGGIALAVLGIGLAVVGVLLLGIAKFAAEVIPAFVVKMRESKVTPESAKMVVDILMSFVDMVVKLSSVIGTLSLSAPFAALGGVVSELFGAKNPFDALTDVLNIITRSVLNLMTILDKMTGDPAALKSKADIFNTVATGLASLIVPTTKIIEIISGRIGSSFQGNVIQTAGQAIVNIIRVLADPRTGVITGILRTLEEMSGNINTDPAKLKGMAEVFNSIANGLGGIISAIGGLLEKFNAGTAFSPTMLVAGGVSVYAKLQALEKVTNSLLPMLKTVLVSIVREISALAENVTNIEGLKALGGVLSAAGQILSSLLDAVTKIMDRGGIGGAIDSVQNLISGRSAASVSDERLHQVQTFITSLTRSMSGLFTGILTGITTLAASIPSDPEKLKALTVVTDLIKALTGMIGPLLTAVSTIVEMSTRNVRTIPGLNAMGEFLRGLITKLTEALGDVLVRQLPELISKLMLIPIQPGLQTKVNALKSVFEIITTMTSIISSMRIPSGASGATRQLNPFYEVFEPIMILLEHLFVNEFHSARLRAVINGMSGRGFGNLELAASRAKGVKSVFEMVKSVAEAAKSLSDLSSGRPITPETITRSLDNVATVIRTIASRTIGTGAGARTNPLLDPTYNLAIMAVNANLNVIEPRIKRISEKLTSLSQASNSIAALTFVPGERIRTMVQAYNDFSVELSRLDAASGNTGPIDVALRRLNTRLQGARSTTIRNAAVNAQINVTVKMEAGQLVETLRTHAEQANQTRQGRSRARPAFATSAFEPRGTYQE